MNVWLHSWRAANNRPGPYWLAMFLFAIFFSLPALMGWLGALGFEALTDRDTDRLVWIALFLFLTELVRIGVIYAAAIQFMTAWELVQGMFRYNMLSAQLASGGPTAGRPVASAGEAITHFRDDPEDVAQFVDSWIDVFGGLCFGAIALGVLGAVNPRATLVILGPMIAVSIVVKVLDDRVKSYRAADRAATAAVTGALGDVLGAATTIKVNDAADAAVAHIDELGEIRRSTAVKDRVLEDGLLAFSNGSGDIALGLVLIVSVGAMRSGDFDVADLAVFTVYLAYLNFLPRMIGRMLARRKQSEVAIGNMSLLVGDGDPVNLTTKIHLRVHPRDPLLVTADLDAPQGTSEPLRSLEVVGLSVRYPDDNGRPALPPISFRLEQGTFTVITGAVGSGKSTLVRALLGLEPRAEVSGEIRWNGQLVEDRGAFFIPPRAAYLPQIPNLPSDSAADNILLGRSDAYLIEAMRLAAVSRDIEAMAEGSDTLVGPRGLRLSGGQRQRLAAARAIVSRSALLVLDDVSSALDVETELELWHNLAQTGTTVLAISNRAIALEAADQVLTLG